MDDGAFLAATIAVATSSSMGHPAFCSKHEAPFCALLPLRKAKIGLGSTDSFSLKYQAAHTLGQDKRP